MKQKTTTKRRFYVLSIIVRTTVRKSFFFIASSSVFFWRWKEKLPWFFLFWILAVKIQKVSLENPEKPSRKKCQWKDVKIKKNSFFNFFEIKSSNIGIYIWNINFHSCEIIPKQWKFRVWDWEKMGNITEYDTNCWSGPLKV